MTSWRYLVFLICLFVVSCDETALVQRKNEIAELKKLLGSQWANKDVESKKDQKYFDNAFEGIGEKTTSSDQDYIASIDKIVRNLHDGHLRLTPPETIPQIKRYSGMKIAKVQGGFALVGCEFSDNCKDLDLPLKIIKVDGNDTETWLQKDSELQYGSSIHGRISVSIDGLYFHKRLSYYAPPRELLLESLAGKQFVKKIVWREAIALGDDSNGQKGNYSCVTVSEVKKGIYQLKVPTFWCGLNSNDSETQVKNNFIAQFEKEISKIDQPKAVILDLRNNGGGGDDEGRMVAGLFIDKEEFWFKISHLLDQGWYATVLRIFEGSWQKPLTVKVSPNKFREKFMGSMLFVLTNSSCFSTCDGIVSSLKHAGVGIILGERTHGGAGDPKEWLFPYSKFKLGYTTALIWQKNGDLIEGKGVDVDYSVVPAMEFFKKSDDPVLDMALTKINNLMAK